MNNKTINTIPVWEKVCLTPREASEYSNIGINRINDMLNNPLCEFALHVGKKRLIKRKLFEAYLDKQLEV